MGRHLLGFQLFRPLVFFKAHEYKVIAHQKRTLRKKSRPSRGATKLLLVGLNSMPISIHAPREGRDPSRPQYGQLFFLFQSTRPARGATYGSLAFYTNCIFQSTRPARGATCQEAVRQLTTGHFNPRAPRGARLATVFRSDRLRHHFNPRAPRGARRGMPQQRSAGHMISIHAPREGRDRLAHILRAIS